MLDLCVWLPEFQSDQAKFGVLLAQWAQRGLPEAAFTVIAIEAGEALPAPSEYDGFLISGSEKGVYDTAPWMQPLRDFLIAARTARKPMFGVCFGHQIMADVFGGKAEKVGQPEVGVRAFEIEGQSVAGHVWHQDQVTQVPPGAQIIGRADYCPVAALAYDFPAMSVQFHPEYQPDYLSTFLRRGRGRILPEAQTDAAVAQIDTGGVSADLFARQAADFFRNNIRANITSGRS